ncbi:hypothetical protein Tco_0009113 [Tanacetum coccineum]
MKMHLRAVKDIQKWRIEMEEGLNTFNKILKVQPFAKAGTTFVPKEPDKEGEKLIITLSSNKERLSSTLLFTMGAKDIIRIQTCVLTKDELSDFLTTYHIPSEYKVMLPKSNQTIFDSPDGYIGLYTHYFSLANLRLLMCCRVGSIY